LSGKYDDIIDLPHHQSSTQPHMSGIDRAAQFSPFQALSGNDSAVKETARLTDQRIELDEDAIEALDERLRYLQEHIEDRPEAAITYFVPDGWKQGGASTTVSGAVKKINTYERLILMMNGTVISIDDIIEIEPFTS